MKGALMRVRLQIKGSSRSIHSFVKLINVKVRQEFKSVVYAGMSAVDVFTENNDHI